MIEVILKLGGLQAFFLGVVLLKRNPRTISNKLLAVLILALGLSCFFYSFNNLDFYLNYPHLIRIDWGIPLLFGPLIYLYTLSLTNSSKKWSNNHYVHFIPYLANLVILAPFFLGSSEDKIQVLDYFTAAITNGTDHYYYYNFILRIAISIIGLSYSIASINLVKTYTDNLLNEYSDIQKIKLDWLRLLLFYYLFLSIIFIVISFLIFGDRYLQLDYNVYYFILVFVLIYALSYKALSHPQIVALSLVDKKDHITPKSTTKLKPSSNKSHFINRYMEESKPFLNGELTASMLADDLHISRHQLSEVLNEEIGNNFYDFINLYRIEEFKSRVQLPENDHLTLLAIALDSGFNSKTSFNTVFKKSTGKTPSQFRKGLK